MNKRILFLSPYSVPVNSPEAICNAKLLKVLADSGYIIDLICKNNSAEYMPDTLDTHFTSRLASSKIFYLKHKITFRTIIDHLRVLLKTGYVYKGAQWAIYAISEGERLIKENHYDVIISRVPSAELAALYLSKKYKIKWIANWNDPYPNKCFPVPYGSGANVRLGKMRHRLFKDIAQHAVVHTFPCQRLCDYMTEYMKLPKEKTLVIPHVCVDGLFDFNEGIRPHNRLRIVHSGNISSPRSPLTLFEGLRKFKKNNPEAEFEIAFIGKQDADFNELVDKFKLDSHIRVLPPLDYLSNLKLMSDYDLALLVEANLEEGVFLPTKVGDYMQCHLPIWTISPQNGTMNDLYNGGKIDYFSNVVNSDSIADEMTVIYKDFINNKGVLPRKGIINEYNSSTVLDLYTNIL